MREFSPGEKKFILKRQSTMSLGDMARRFHCDWKEVYNVYSEMLDNGEYMEYMEREAQKRKRIKANKRLVELYKKLKCKIKKGDTNGQGISGQEKQESNESFNNDNV